MSFFNILGEKVTQPFSVIIIMILALCPPSFAAENVVGKSEISLYHDANNRIQTKPGLNADQKIKVLSAEERFGELNEIEKTNRIAGGLGKLGFGAISLYYGNKLSSDPGPAGMWGTGITAGVGFCLEIAGVLFGSWGISDTWFNATQVEKDYSEMTKLSSYERERYSLEYLRSNAKEANARRAAKIWNLFGLLSLNETQVEIEYKEYSKDHPEMNK